MNTQAYTNDFLNQTQNMDETWLWGRVNVIDKLYQAKNKLGNKAE